MRRATNSYEYWARKQKEEEQKKAENLKNELELEKRVENLKNDFTKLDDSIRKTTKFFNVTFSFRLLG